MKRFPLIKPYITGNTHAKVAEVLDSGFLTEGKVTKELEQAFCEYLQVPHAIAFTSCTTGLETALRALDIGTGDEVIVPSYTYPATAAVIAIVGATAVIVDVDPRNMLIDYNAISAAITEKTKALMPVSLFGNPLDYEQLGKISEKHDLYIIEDAACSIGSVYDEQKVGTHADIAVFSMHPRKFITTGEGGMLTTRNSEWAEWIESYKHFGMAKTDAGMVFERVGTNYKMSDLLAAVGLEQMSVVDSLLERRRELAQSYIELLAHSEHVTLPSVTDKGNHSYQSFCVFIESRDKVMADLRSQGIEVQIGSIALHRQPAFANNDAFRIEGPMNGTQYAANHALTLPLYNDLSRDDQVYILEHLHESIQTA